MRWLKNSCKCLKTSEGYTIWPKLFQVPKGTRRTLERAEDNLIMGAYANNLLVMLYAHEKVGGLGINERGGTCIFIHMDDHRSLNILSY